MANVIGVENEYNVIQWQIVQTVALVSNEVDVWQVAAVQMRDLETNCEVRAFGGGA